MTDSRGQLEEDIRKFWAIADGLASHMVGEPYIAWLDRQEAITRKECEYAARCRNRDGERMQFITGGRGSGKTTKLIQMSHDYWMYIVCSNRRAADNIAHMAREMKIDIPNPVSFEELPCSSRFIEEVLVDDADILIEKFIEAHVRAASFSIKDDSQRQGRSILELETKCEQLEDIALDMFTYLVFDSMPTVPEVKQSVIDDFRKRLHEQSVVIWDDHELTCRSKLVSSDE